MEKANGSSVDTSVLDTRHYGLGDWNDPIKWVRLASSLGEGVDELVDAVGTAIDALRLWVGRVHELDVADAYVKAALLVMGTESMLLTSRGEAIAADLAVAAAWEFTNAWPCESGFWSAKDADAMMAVIEPALKSLDRYDEVASIMKSRRMSHLPPVKPPSTPAVKPKRSKPRRSKRAA